MEANQVDVVTAAVTGGLHQVLRTGETRIARQFVGDVRLPDRGYRIHHDVSLVHRVSTAHFHVEPLPDADAAPDSPAANAVAKTFREHHDEAVTLRMSSSRHISGSSAACVSWLPARRDAGCAPRHGTAAR